jgi:hypothetical protein
VVLKIAQGFSAGFNDAHSSKSRRDERKPLSSLALLSVRIFENREDFGLRWPSAVATSLFNCGQSFQGGVALRFPPQSKIIGCGYAALWDFSFD